MTRKRSYHFRRPYQKPNVDRSKPFSPALAFAVNFDMLSDEEIEDVRSGKATIESSYLIYKKGHTKRFPPSHLYKDRRIDLLADKLLGIDDE